LFLLVFLWRSSRFSSPLLYCRFAEVHVLLVIGLLRRTADDLNLVGCDAGPTVVQLKRDVLDHECPDFVAEAVGIEGALYRTTSALLVSLSSPRTIITAGQPLLRGLNKAKSVP
jgi:hypothetical protein